jgi:hypothetical protein
MEGPKVIFGTKEPSITSRWSHGAPEDSISTAALPNSEKSADNIEGETMVLFIF